MRGALIACSWAAMLAAAAALVAAPAQAARPMVTDDARIADAGACQLETWVQNNRASTEYWALPACNFTGNLELTLGGALTRQAGQTRTTDAVMQGKTVLRPLETNGWGLALAAGTNHRPLANGGSRNWYVNAPVSFSLRDDAVMLHANLGWLRDGEIRRDRLTWGLGAEARLAERAWLIAETFGQNRGKPSYQFGLRRWLIVDRVQIDATYGNPYGTDTRARWFSIGLRLLSPPFLR